MSREEDLIAELGLSVAGSETPVAPTSDGKTEDDLIAELGLSVAGQAAPQQPAQPQGLREITPPAPAPAAPQGPIESPGAMSQGFDFAFNPLRKAYDLMTDPQQREMLLKDVKDAYQQLTDPRASYERRLEEAGISLHGGRTGVPRTLPKPISLPERIQDLFTGHLRATKESMAGGSFEQLKELRETPSAAAKAALGTVLGASNEEIFQSMLKDQPLVDKGVKFGEDSKGNKYMQGADGEKMFFQPGANMVDVAGLVGELSLLRVGGALTRGVLSQIPAAKALLKFYTSGKLAPSAVRGATEMAALEGAQELTGSGNIDLVNIGLGAGGEMLGRAVTALPESLIKTPQFMKLADDGVQGDPAATQEIAKIMNQGSPQQKESFQNAMELMGFKVDQAGKVTAKDVDINDALKYVIDTPKPDLTRLALAFKKNPELIKLAKDEGLLKYLNPADIIDRGDELGREVADSIIKENSRRTKLEGLAKELTERVQRLGVEGNLGKTSKQMGVDIFNDIEKLRADSSAAHKVFYKELGEGTRVDSDDVIKEIKDMIAKRKGGSRGLKKGFRWAKGQKPKSGATPLEKQIIAELRKKKSESKAPISPAVSEDLLSGRKAQAAQFEKDLVPPTFQEINELKKMVGDLMDDSAFLDRTGGHANALYGILKRKVDSSLDELAQKGDIDPKLIGDWEELNKDVINYKNIERGHQKLFGKAFRDALTGEVRLEKDLGASTRSALKDVEKDGQVKFENMLLSLEPEYRGKYLSEGLMHTLSNDFADKGFKAFGQLWRGVKKNDDLQKMMNTHMPEGQLEMFETIGKISDVIYESTAKKAPGASEGSIQRLAQEKENILRKLARDTETSIGASMITKVVQKIPIIGGNGSLALSLGILNAMKNVTKERASADQLLEFIRSEQFTKLMASDLKDMDYMQFAKDNKVQLMLEQMGVAKDFKEIERTMKSWAREDDSDTPEEIK